MPRICILNGKHTPGSDWERECPQLAAERRAKAAGVRYKAPNLNSAPSVGGQPRKSSWGGARKGAGRRSK